MRTPRRFLRPARRPLRSSFAMRPSNRSTPMKFFSGWRCAHSTKKEASPQPSSTSNGCGDEKSSLRASGSTMERSSTTRFVWRSTANDLLGALVNPGANQADFFRRELLGILALGHETIRIANMRDGQNQVAMRAVAGLDDSPISAAFKCGREAIQRETAGGLFGTFAA